MNRGKAFSLRGRKILVTGAAGFLGRELCGYLLADGAVVFAADVDEERLASVEKQLNPRKGFMFSFHADLSEEGQRRDLVAEMGNHTDSLDGAVFAAAFVGTSDLDGWAVDFSEQSLSTWRNAIELNLTAPFHLTQLLVPLLSRGQEPSVVNIGSIYGSIGPDWSLYEGLEMSNPAAYAVSKGGLVQLTRWLASTMAPHIRVNAVSPGGIERGQAGQFVTRYSKKTLLGRMAEEADVVGPIVFLLSDASRYITGQNLLVDGGYVSV